MRSPDRAGRRASAGPFRTARIALGALRIRALDAIDLRLSRSVAVDGVRTACLMLGPYRNLTTLTASALFLHPNCQVLNHAGRRMLGNDAVDFLRNDSLPKLDRFLQFAIRISRRAGRGSSGGSIVYSHAFDAGRVIADVYRGKSSGLVKRDIACVVWKESLLTSNAIRDRRISIDRAVATENRLRFLMPVRNPLDCAVSNLKTGHFVLFQGLEKDATVEDVLRAILNEILWFVEHRARFPGAFFCFFEHSIFRKTLLDLLAFLKLAPDETWVSSALAAMDVKSDYEHARELVATYVDIVKERFGAYPEVRASLLRFAEQPASPRTGTDKA